MERSEFTEAVDIIRKTIRSRYSKNVPAVDFIRSELIDTTRFEVNLLSLSISSDTQPDYPLHLVKWRIAQTRIHISQVAFQKCAIWFIEYFDSFFVLVQNNNENPLSLNLIIKNNSSALLVKAQSTGCISNDKDYSKLPATFLKKTIDHEKGIHPLSFFSSHDITCLKNVDEAWCNLQCIDQKGLINDHFDLKNANDLAVFILLEELYFILGKQNYFTQILKKTSGELNHAYEFLPVEEQKNYFLSVSSDVAKEQIQHLWDIISLPAMALKVTRLLNNKPYFLVMFLLAVYKNNFWWRANATAFVLKHLQQNDDSRVYELCRLLASVYDKTAFNTDADNAKITFHPGGFSNTFLNDSIRVGGFKYKVNRFSDRVFTSVESRAGIILNIDKAATIIVSENNFKIIPHTHQYSIKTLNYITVQIENKIISIPLAWDKFRVTINGLRIHFLFKKTRFQLNVKTKQAGKVLIDSVEIGASDSPYSRLYITPEKRPASNTLHFFDDIGRGINPRAIAVNNKKISVHTAAIDTFAKLLGQVVLRSPESKKNQVIDPLSIPATPVKLSAQCEFVFPKTQVIMVNAIKTDARVNALLMTESSVLKQQISLVVESEAMLKKALDNFYSTFGFYIYNSYVRKNINEAEFNLIVHDTLFAKTVKDDALWNIQLLQHSQGKKSILFSEKSFSAWCSIYRKL